MVRPARAGRHAGATSSPVSRKSPSRSRTPALKERLLAQGAIPAGGTPDEFARHIAAETKKWAQVVKVSGAKVD